MRDSESRRHLRGECSSICYICARENDRYNPTPPGWANTQRWFTSREKGARG